MKAYLPAIFIASLVCLCALVILISLGKIPFIKTSEIQIQPRHHFTYQGHHYLYFSRQSGIVHDPDCKCQNK